MWMTLIQCVDYLAAHSTQVYVNGLYPCSVLIGNRTEEQLHPHKKETCVKIEQM